MGLNKKGSVHDVKKDHEGPKRRKVKEKVKKKRSQTWARKQVLHLLWSKSFERKLEDPQKNMDSLEDPEKDVVV